jgi:hypothetical protein
MSSDGPGEENGRATRAMPMLIALHRGHAAAVLASLADVVHKAEHEKPGMRAKWRDALVGEEVRGGSGVAASPKSGCARDRRSSGKAVGVR